MKTGTTAGWRCRALAWILGCALAWPALAADWVLALSWAPGFCAGHPDKRQCRLLDRQDDTDAAYARRHLTLHGLWPRRQDCQAPPLRAADLPAELGHYMPGLVDGLALHEWSRHGSCSGYTARGYFEQMIAMARAADDSALGRYLSAHAGERVTLEALHRAGAPDFGGAAAQSVRFLCRGERLEEVRFSLRDWAQALDKPGLAGLFRPAAAPDRCDDSVLL